ncbi:MAG: methyltransferase, partial [Candidatus Omnitrophica bacterium]|nr:methyltransferase [Candidatus Omnitrophota bacterium]
MNKIKTKNFSFIFNTTVLLITQIFLISNISWGGVIVSSKYSVSNMPYYLSPTIKINEQKLRNSFQLKHEHIYNKEDAILEIFRKNMDIDISTEIEASAREGDCFISKIKNPQQIQKLIDSRLRAKDYELLSYKSKNKSYLLAILFFSATEGKKYYIKLLNEEIVPSEKMVTLNKKLLEYFFQFPFGTASYLKYADLIISVKINRSLEASKVIDIALRQYLGVYSFDNTYSGHLLDAVITDIKNENKVLILGTGAGLEAVVIAKKIGCLVDAIDIQPIAVVNTLVNAVVTDTQELIDAWVSDGFSTVSKKYDIIIFNAPLPTRKATTKSDVNRFDGEGKLIRRILDELPAYLEKEGTLFLMSHENIALYLPPTLTTNIKEKFTKANFSLAIHEITVN